MKLLLVNQALAGEWSPPARGAWIETITNY